MLLRKEEDTGERWCAAAVAGEAVELMAGLSTFLLFGEDFSERAQEATESLVL